MHYYVVSPLIIVRSDSFTFTYAAEQRLMPGQLVTISVGKKNVAGIILDETTRPSFQTKLLEPIGEIVIPSELLKLHQWLSTYYSSHPATVWQTMLPSGIAKKRRKLLENPVSPLRKRTNYLLNKHQQQAHAHILQRAGKTTLLHGITGSGKTAIYIELAKTMLKENKSSIILVPEIALTSQLVAEFTHHIPDILVTHSGLTESQRHTIWLETLNSSTPRVIVGPRSALFAPLSSVGLIVIDECHEPSYKQEKTPRYSALRAASVLSKLHHARLVLGSATPSVQDYFIAKNTDEDSIIKLDTLARPSAILPEVEIVDMTVKSNFSRSIFLSTVLLKSIEQTLGAGGQSLLFHNRRGSAPITLCEQCGWSASCPNCFVPLTLHTDNHILRCHLCNHREHIPTACPSCSNASIIHKGIGTKRIVEELARLFPAARIARFDGDNTALETVDKQYQQLYDGEIDIIVGTQVIAKGLDLPRLRLVGVVQADSGLALPDYQSAERVFQLLAQVAGRVGRNEHKSRVVLQSYQPQHSSVKYGVSRDYDGFYTEALAERKRANFPPYCYLLKMVCVYKSEQAAIRATKKFAQYLRPLLQPSSTLLGPTPAFYERVRNSYRWQLIVKSNSRAELIELTKHIPSTHWQFELDPSNLL